MPDKNDQTIDINMRLAVDIERNIQVVGWEVASTGPRGDGRVTARRPDPRKFDLVYDGTEWRIAVVHPSSRPAVGFMITVCESMP